MNSQFRPRILYLARMLTEERAALEALGEVVMMPGLRDPAGADAAVLAGVDAVITAGTIGFSPAMFAACPRVRHIHCLGAGYENVDLAEARRRGIPVSNGSGSNADSVADHALALILSLLRNIPRFDSEIRAGSWKPVPVRAQLTGLNVGVLGLGEIGLRIARRAAAFDAPIHYSATRPKDVGSWTFHANIRDLATASEVLFVACPGGARTRHMVNADILQALGPGGFLVNIARGSVVDTEALGTALRNGTIAGAALDVVEGEPMIPAALTGCPNLVMTPHVAGSSPAAERGMARLARENLKSVFAGQAPLTPVK